MSVPCWGCQLPLPDGVSFCPRCGASQADDETAAATHLGRTPTSQPAPGLPFGTQPSTPPTLVSTPASVPPMGAPYGGESLPPYVVQSGLSSPAGSPPPSTKTRTVLAIGAGFVVLIALGVVIGLFRGPIMSAVGLRPATPTPTPTAPPSSRPPSSGPASSKPASDPPSSPPVSSPPSSKPPTTTAPPPSSPPATPTAAPTTFTVFAVTVARTCGSNGKGDCYLSERAEPKGNAAELKRWPDKSGLTVVCQVQGQAVSSSALNRSSTVWSRTTTGGYVANIFLDGLDAFNVTTPC